MTQPVVFNVVQLGEFPATRSKARDGRNLLEEILAGKMGVDLTIDFTNVTAMTISFAACSWSNWSGMPTVTSKKLGTGPS